MTQVFKRRFAGYGWHRDLPDHRDFVYKAAASTIPASVDLRPLCPPVYDQGQTGSCTGNAIAGAIEFDRRKQGLTDFVPSRLFIYWCERAIEGTTASDVGASLRDGIKSVKVDGAPPETLWPFVEAQLTVKPSDAAYAAARSDLVLVYHRIRGNSLSAMLDCLAVGFPFVFGIAAYESLESEVVARTGVVPIPGPKEKMIGGHAIMAVGYNQASRLLTFRNSWGADWGKAGYGFMPYDFVTDPGLASDFWTIRSVATATPAA